MRRVAIPLVVIAFLAATLFVALRGTDDVAAPSVRDAARETISEAPPRAPRAHAATPAQPAAPRSIRVAVTAPDGTPIPGARVELFRGPAGEQWTDNEADDFRPSIAPPKPERTATAGSGDAVFAEVPQGRWFVAAGAPGFGRHVAVGVSRDGDDDFAATLMLVKGTAFTGTIADEKGAPAADVAVVLAPTWNATPWPGDAACLRTTSGRDGAYRFDFVEPGEYRLWYAPQTDLLLLADRVRVPAVDRYDIALSAGATIEGTIGDVDSGAPLADAVVLAVQNYSSYVRESPLPVAAGRTDAHGRFSIRTWTSPSPFETILVDDPRCAPWPVDGTGKFAAGTLEEGQHAALDVRVRRGATVTGVVVGPDGPIPGFEIHLHPQDDAWQLPGDGEIRRASKTGADGRFAFTRLSAGKAWAAAYRPRPLADAVANDELTLEAAAETVHDIHVDAVSARIAHRIVDASGTPVQDVEVSQDEGSLRATARTDADGRFALDVQLFAGLAYVTLRHDGFQTGCLAGRPAEPDDQDWVLNRSRDAIGTVRDADGNPVAGARIVMLPGEAAQGAFFLLWRGLGESFSRADGTFRVPTVTQDSEGLVAHRLTDGAWSKLVGVADANDVEGTKLQFPATRRITGCVVAAGSDTPVPGVLVHGNRASNGADDVVIGRTGDDGRFAVDFEPAKDGALRLVRAGWIARRLSDDVADGLRVELTPSLVLGGVAKFDDGAPVTGAIVSTAPDPGVLDFSRDSTSDDSGRFLVRDVGPGSWPVVLRRRDNTIVPVRLSAVAGDHALVVVVRHALPLTVEVADAEGAAVTSATVSVEADATATASDTTDMNGSATIAGLAGAPLVLRVECDGFEPAERRGVRAGGEALRVVLTRKAPR